MKKTITIAALVIATSTPASASTSNVFSGNWLHQICFSQDSTNKLACNAFISGFLYGLNSTQQFSGIKDSNYKPLVCVPTEFQTGQGIDITKKYIDNNPQLRHHAAEMMVMTAMLQAFPCN